MYVLKGIKTICTWYLGNSFKMHFLPFVLLLTIGPLVHSRPSKGVRVDDVIYSPEQLQFFEGHKASRVAMAWSQYYWKNGTLVYSFDKGVSKWDMAMVESAMKEISSQTCIKFRRTFNPSEQQLVVQRDSYGCFAEAGYQGKSRQVLNLGEGCMYNEVILHELLHALALFHTQNHPNRDQYVKIIRENIEPGMEYNFDKLQAGWVTDFEMGYDYGSIMHYGSYAFAWRGRKTIVPLQPNVIIGEATKLSPQDVELLNRIYC